MLLLVGSAEYALALARRVGSLHGHRSNTTTEPHTVAAFEMTPASTDLHPRTQGAHEVVASGFGGR